MLTLLKCNLQTYGKGEPLGLRKAFHCLSLAYDLAGYEGCLAIAVGELGTVLRVYRASKDLHDRAGRQPNCREAARCPPGKLIDVSYQS